MTYQALICVYLFIALFSPRNSVGKRKATGTNAPCPCFPASSGALRWFFFSAGVSSMHRIASSSRLIHRYNSFRYFFAKFPGFRGLLNMNALCGKPVNQVVRTEPLEFSDCQSSSQS